MLKDIGRNGTSRRVFLGSAASGAAGLVLGAEAGRTVQAATVSPARSTVRDHFWIFTVFAGGDNKSLEAGGVHGGSRMTPAEGAFWLNVPNLLLIRSGGHPPLPDTQPEHAVTSFDQYAISFQPLDQVVWSVVGSGGKGGMAELAPVVDLAKEYTNIGGIYLDDFIIDAKRQADGTTVGRPALQPAELTEARDQLKSVGRPMDIWITLYTHEICPPRRTTSPSFRGCNPPLSEFLHLFDVLTLWTWNADELPALEENLAALEAMVSMNQRIALGLYMWDFPNRRPVPMELMKHQCDLGLKWLREGRIHEMIFLANTVLDVGLPSAKFAREWIAEVGAEAV